MPRGRSEIAGLRSSAAEAGLVASSSATHSTDRQALPATTTLSAAPPRAARRLNASACDLARPKRLHEHAVYDSSKLARARGACVDAGHQERVTPASPRSPRWRHRGATGGHSFELGECSPMTMPLSRNDKGKLCRARSSQRLVETGSARGFGAWAGL